MVRFLRRLLGLKRRLARPAGEQHTHSRTPGEEIVPLFDAFRFDGKRVLVVGGASGMGAAAAELALDAGGEVVVWDYADVSIDGVQPIHVDLSDRESIDDAVDACAGPIHALLACAGVAPGTAAIERINFIGHRHVIDRMIDRGVLGRGAAIGFISSAAGLGWESNLELWKDLFATPDFDNAVAWVEKHGKADYGSMKQAICAYVATQAYPMLKRGIRLNATCPGPTDTPLARANAETWLGFGADYRKEVGIEASTPLEQAFPLLFLCSDAAAGITGTTMITDSGYMSSGVTGVYAPAIVPSQVLMGRLDLDPIGSKDG